MSQDFDESDLPFPTTVCIATALNEPKQAALGVTKFASTWLAESQRSCNPADDKRLAWAGGASHNRHDLAVRQDGFDDVRY
jgi:hypothetical protein